MKRLTFLQGDSSCPAYFMIAVTFTSHPPTHSSQADKTALSLPSRLDFTLMTLHLHLSFVSLSPQLPLFLDSQLGCHLYANTHVIQWKKILQEKTVFPPIAK